jgi:hypothetical protein
MGKRRIAQISLGNFSGMRENKAQWKYGNPSSGIFERI